jgi:uncharacterized membrane protein
MNANYVFAVAIGIGIVAGLRSFTAPAITSWAAHLGWLDLQGSRLAFMGSATAVVILSVLAVLEYVGDLLPQTPSRTKPGPLIARILMGALCGACVYTAVNRAPWAGGLLGGLGAVIGAFGGHQARMRLVSRLKLKDAAVAIPEDFVAIGLACLLLFLR